MDSIIRTIKPYLPENVEQKGGFFRQIYKKLVLSKDLTKKAAEMLLKGATLLSDPCPYCRGVRVMKEGQALCISCGREPMKKNIPTEKVTQNSESTLEKTLNKKLDMLSKELEMEKDPEKQQQILKSINTILETIEKVKNKQ